MTIRVCHKQTEIWEFSTEPESTSLTADVVAKFDIMSMDEKVDQMEKLSDMIQGIVSSVYMYILYTQEHTLYMAERRHQNPDRHTYEFVPLCQ